MHHVCIPSCNPCGDQRMLFLEQRLYDLQKSVNEIEFNMRGNSNYLRPRRAKTSSGINTARPIRYRTRSAQVSESSHSTLTGPDNVAKMPANHGAMTARHVTMEAKNQQFLLPSDQNHLKPNPFRVANTSQIATRPATIEGNNPQLLFPNDGNIVRPNYNHFMVANTPRLAARPATEANDPQLLSPNDGTIPRPNYNPFMVANTPRPTGRPATIEANNQQFLSPNEGNNARITYNPFIVANTPRVVNRSGMIEASHTKFLYPNDENNLRINFASNPQTALQQGTHFPSTNYKRDRQLGNLASSPIINTARNHHNVLSSTYDNLDGSMTARQVRQTGIRPNTTDRANLSLAGVHDNQGGYQCSNQFYTSTPKARTTGHSNTNSQDFYGKSETQPSYTQLSNYSESPIEKRHSSYELNSETQKCEQYSLIEIDNESKVPPHQFSEPKTEEFSSFVDFSDPVNNRSHRDSINQKQTNAKTPEVNIIPKKRPAQFLSVNNNIHPFEKIKINKPKNLYPVSNTSLQETPRSSNQRQSLQNVYIRQNQEPEFDLHGFLEEQNKMCEQLLRILKPDNT